MAARNPVAQALPRELYVEVTNRCNSLCPACVRTFRKPEPLRDLTLGEFEAIVDQFPALERVVLHGIGEPLLNADLPAIIRAIKARFPSAAVLFNSNAVLLDEGWRRSLAGQTLRRIMRGEVALEVHDGAIEIREAPDALPA